MCGGLKSAPVNTWNVQVGPSFAMCTGSTQCAAVRMTCGEITTPLHGTHSPFAYVWKTSTTEVSTESAAPPMIGSALLPVISSTLDEQPAPIDNEPTTAAANSVRTTFFIELRKPARAGVSDGAALRA